MRKWLWIAVAAIIVVSGGIAVAVSSGGGGGSKPLIVTEAVRRRDLRDEVTVQGTLGRVEERTINAATNGAVSRVYANDGVTLATGASVLALDGRDSVTADGVFPFFRKLDVGAVGSDVLQLEQILQASGFSPGRVDTVYTAQTRFALAQWQAAHNYPGAAPQTNQTVNVALQQSTGYKLGAQTAAGATIAPTVRAAALRTGSEPKMQGSMEAVMHRPMSNVVPVSVRADPATPTLTIQAISSVTPKGSAASFVVQSDSATHPAVNFTVSLGGTAGPNDVITPSGAFTLAADATSTTIQIQTKQNNLVEPDKTLIVTLDGGSDHFVGSPASATTTIQSTTVPEIDISGTATVTAGQNATLTITADQAPVNDLLIGLNVAGNAVADTDYVSFNPSVVLPAGQTSTSLTIVTKVPLVVGPDKRIVVSLAPSPGAAYKIGATATATITIPGASGPAAFPVVTIRPSTARVNEGQPAQFVVGIDRILSQQLQISLTFSGNAVEGGDYSPPGGLLVLQPGQTSLQVSVPTLDDGLVEPDKVLIATVQPTLNYTVGSPNAGAVLIQSEDLPKITIVGGPVDTTKGSAITFTVVADQPPIEDTSVQYSVTGTAKPGQNFVPVTGTVLLRAGQTTASIPILTLNDDVTFQPTDIITGAWPTRVGTVEVKEGDVTVPGKPLFSLTETGFTVTLRASAADRTKLKVGQTTTVQLQGGTGTAPGVISELDDTATTDQTTKTQVYEGKVQVQGDLGAADGAPVTIKVVLQEHLNALTVPIAAVLQNGAGQDIVRVIDLQHGGKITEVRVKTGLSEGSFIEIQSGLKGNEVVVVELDKGS